MPLKRKIIFLIEGFPSLESLLTVVYIFPGHEQRQCALY